MLDDHTHKSLEGFLNLESAFLSDRDDDTEQNTWAFWIVSQIKEGYHIVMADGLHVKKRYLKRNYAKDVVFPTFGVYISFILLRLLLRLTVRLSRIIRPQIFVVPLRLLMAF